MGSNFLEYTACVICPSKEYIVLKAAQYSDDIDFIELLRGYRSSSEVKLMDQLVQCGDCGLTYTNPRFSSTLAYQGYSEAIDVRHKEQEKYRQLSFKRAMLKMRNFLDWGGQESRMRVLDVGCAGGAFLNAVRDSGHEAIGIEPSKYLSSYAREEHGLMVFSETLSDFSKNNSLPFDVITFWDVLEHISDPQVSLEIAREMLAKNGTLILNLPMIDTWPAKLLGSKWPFYLNVHLYYFNKNTIEKFLQKTGFQLEGMKMYTQTLSFGYILERAGIGKASSGAFMSSIPFKYYLGQRTIIARKV